MNKSGLLLKDFVLKKIEHENNVTYKFTNTYMEMFMNEYNIYK